MFSYLLTHNVQQVQHGPLNQSARAGIVEKPIHSEQTHGQHPKQYLRKESFSSFRADSRTQSDAVGMLQNEPLNPSVCREESHAEPLQRNITMPGKKKYGFVFGPKSWQEGNVQEGQLNQVVRASQAQVIPTNSSLHANQIGGGFPYDTISMHNKRATEHVAAPSAMEHEQITQHRVVHEQQAGEIPSDTVQPNQVVRASQAQVIPTKSSVHANQTEGGLPYETISVHNKQATEHVAAPSVTEHEQITPRHQIFHEQEAGEIPSDTVQVEQEKVDSACKPSSKNKKSTKNTKGNHKRKNKNLMNSPNEWSHLRRSKRLSKGSPDFIDTESIQKLDASPDQNHSEAPQIESTVADPASSSPTRYQCLQAGSIELDNIDVTSAPTLSDGTLQGEQFPHSYSQIYSPETRWVLPSPSSNSWHEHEIPQDSFNGIDQLDKSDAEVCLNPSENQNHMDGEVAEAACNGKNYLEQVQVKPHGKKFAEHGGQMNLAASCSRLAAMLPVPAATTFPTIASLSSLESQSLSPTYLVISILSCVSLTCASHSCRATTSVQQSDDAAAPTSAGPYSLPLLY
jgi:hypothetical protein